MKRALAICLVSLLPFTGGCSALKAETGEYVTEAVQEHINKTVEQKLAERGLSSKDIKALIEKDPDGNADILKTIKNTTKDAALIEANKLIQQKLAEYNAQIATKGELDSKSKELWYEILTVLGGALSAYLAKQLVSQRNAHSKDKSLAEAKTRIETLEKLLGAKPS